MLLCDIIIRCEMIDNNVYEVVVKCGKCASRFDKYLKNNKSTVIKCVNCGKRYVIIPCEVSEDSGEIIDFYIVAYEWYNKTIKVWIKDNENKIKNLSKKEIDTYKLNYIKNLLCSHIDNE